MFKSASRKQFGAGGVGGYQSAHTEPPAESDGGLLTSSSMARKDSLKRFINLSNPNQAS
jgi:hypothetical protein